MRKNGIKDFKWIFYRQNLGKLLKISFLALVGLFFQKKWGTNKIKSVSTYPWNVKWILLFSNFDFHILSPPPRHGVASWWSILPPSFNASQNPTQLNSTQRNSKATSVGVRHSSHVYPTHPTHPTPPPQTFQPLLDQLESWNLAQTLTRPI